jgi:hypothetical protein
LARAATLAAALIWLTLGKPPGRPSRTPQSTLIGELPQRRRVAHQGAGEARLRPICVPTPADCAKVCSARYSVRPASLLLCIQKASLTRRYSSEWAMLSEGRLFWLGPLEWSVLLISAALCGYLALMI